MSGGNVICDFRSASDEVFRVVNGRLMYDMEIVAG